MNLSSPIQFLVLLLARQMNQAQQRVIAYLQAENRVLRERLTPSPLRLTDAERRRLAEKGKLLGRKSLAAFAAIAQCLVSKTSSRKRADPILEHYGVRLSVGLAHACALKSDGTLWCWGANGIGELGDGTGFFPSPVPVR